MRRAKFDDTVDEELVTNAFDTLMGIHWGNFEPDPVYLEKGINKKKPTKKTEKAQTPPSTLNTKLTCFVACSIS